MIKINISGFYRLQADRNETEFARALGISRTHLWRAKRGANVGPDFMASFKAAYPGLKLEDYFEII